MSASLLFRSLITSSAKPLAAVTALAVHQPASYLVASNVWRRLLSSQSLKPTTSAVAEKSDNNVPTSDYENLDMPDPTMENPFLKEKRQCILCRHQIEVDYKNVRLLSQFVSPYTGRLYDKHITGLCEKQHRAVKREFKRARKFGLMSPYYRDPKYAEDPRLFDPTKPERANPY